MKCVTVCYKGDLCEVIVSDGVIYKEGFCALYGEIVEALYCSEAVLSWMLNGSCRGMKIPMVCGDYRHAGMMSCRGRVNARTFAQLV